MSSIMNGQNGVRMTYGNLLTTIALAGAGFLWITNVSSATEANAAEIDKQKELQQLRDKHLLEKMVNIEKLLEKLTQE